MNTADIIRRIEFVTALAERGATAGERDAAQRMLERLTAKLEKLRAEQPSGGNGYRPPARAYGEKYSEVADLRLTDIAKRIRADIKLARKVAKAMAAPGAMVTVDPLRDAPETLKYSVRTQYYSGGGSIDITITGVPEDWGWVTEKDPHFPDETRRMPSPALRAVAKELAAITAAYNYNGSDLVTDYFDVRFYSNVTTDGGLILA